MLDKNNFYFQNSLRSLLNWFLRPDSNNLIDKGYHNVVLIAHQISSSFHLSHITPTNRLPVSRKKIILKDFNPSLYTSQDLEYFSPLIELYGFVNDEMRDLVSHFILHGSMATLDYSKGWSDVDTFVVIKSDVVSNVTSLLKLRDVSYDAHKFLYRVDPLQHHGLIFISEDDLNAYPSYYLPSAALKNSVSLLDGRNNLDIDYRDSKQEAIKGILSRVNLIKDAQKEGVFRHHSYNGEYLLENYKNAPNAMYQMKYYLGMFSLFPAQILGVLDQECYKGDSFAAARHLFTSTAWEVVEKITRIREMWSQQESHPYLSNKIPDWLQEELGPDYFSIGDEFLEEITKICNRQLI